MMKIELNIARKISDSAEENIKLEIPPEINNWHSANGMHIYFEGNSDEAEYFLKLIKHYYSIN